MKLTTKLLLLILSLALVITCFAACTTKPGNNDPKETKKPGGRESFSDDDESQTEPEEQKVPLVELPEATYDYTFRIYHEEDGLLIKGFYVKEESNDVVEQAVFERNEAVGERFGIEYQLFRAADGDGVDAMANIEAGSDDYDLLCPHGRYSISYLLKGYLVEWYEGLPNINVYYDWWNQAARDCFTLNDKLFFCTGDINHYSTASAYILLCNGTRLEDCEVEIPYADVENGTWTWEKFCRINADCSWDRNGDGNYVLGDDIVGYITGQWMGPLAAFYSAGNISLTRGNNGEATLTVGTESAFNALTAFFEEVNKNYNYNGFCADGNLPAGGADAVRAGDFLFCQSTLAYMVQNFSKVEYEYALLPFPKLDPDVDHYTAHISGATPFCLVPITASNKTRTAVILEALAQEGSNTVVPTYLQSVVETRAMRNTENYKMLEIIRRGQVYDLGYYYLGFIGTVPVGLAPERSAQEFYSRIESADSKTQQQLIDLFDAFSD